ncbi:MAG TPA: CPBP family intramembrane glutamic endopeptidase [Anaerolineaceae bacterium]|nr:CPBP family intramembrane glutamic endopeptidase [Anaerolineaceae bacterium]
MHSSTALPALARKLTTRQWILLAAPFVLTASMAGIYQWFDAAIGYPAGYLAAFAVYWFGWCILFPAALLGGFRELVDLFRPFPRFGQLGWKTHLLLWWPVVFPLAFALIPRLSMVNGPILLGSLLIGLLIGVTEEIFWRGLFFRLFPGNAWLNLVYPSILFGLWHIAPQTVRASTMPGGVYSFVFYAVILGVSYAFSVRRTKSIAWCTISHVLHDTLGLGALAYAAWLGWA